MSIINLGTYPPKKCGIAAFSKDLRDNLELLGQNVHIGAISDNEYSYSYPPEVIFELRQHELTDYEMTARLLNLSSDVELCIIQHEYGIFGGPDGEYILSFTGKLKKPFILIAHTVLPAPSDNQQRILSLLCRQAAGVVCMSRRSARLLTSVFSVPASKICVIHHGVPVFPPQDREVLKACYGMEGRQLITTFGLIGPGKGLENGIKALAQILPKHPDVHYLIAGETHPILKKKEGESYREMLAEMVSDPVIKGHVTFFNKFLPLDLLGDYLAMTDVYLSPYPNMDQAVSGTLAYAIGAGRAVVSSPYEYALELLQEGRCGILALSARPSHLADVLDRVLSDARLKSALEDRARKVGQKMAWPHVAEQYQLLINNMIRKPNSGVVPVG